MIERFKKYVTTNSLFESNSKILLAMSGGVDSVVLFHLFLMQGVNFKVAHCNFNLRGAESIRDENFVKDLCLTHQVQLHVKHFDTLEIAKIQKKSIEETARNLRYDWFYTFIKDCEIDCIATAHHANDNIETVLMNIFRGTGLLGLKGILAKQQHIIRPLLFAKKTEIEEFAGQNNFGFVFDSSNATVDYTRNFFRNELIPAIEKVYPEVEQNMLNNIDRWKDMTELYNEKIAEIKSKLLEVKGNEIGIACLKLAKVKQQSTIIYEIIKEYNFTAQQVHEVQKLLNSDSGKFILSTTHRILKNRNWLIISENTAVDNSIYLLEDANSSVLIGKNTIKNSLVNAPKVFTDDANSCTLDASAIEFPLIVRRYKTGDYFYPLGMRKKKKLSKFFGDLKLSLSQKENVWVVESNKKIVWVVGLRIDNRFKVLENSSNDVLKISFT